jgi:hypothetical protein
VPPNAATLLHKRCLYLQRSACRNSVADIQHVTDLGKQFVDELEEFFVNYRSLTGEQYWIVGAKVPREAKSRLKDGMRALERSQHHCSAPAEQLEWCESHNKR